MLLKLHVLTRNYKWVISYIQILFSLKGRLFRVKIPYFIRRSNLTDTMITDMENIIRTLNRE